jgi:para-aminobenzoate synthetase
MNAPDPGEVFAAEFGTAAHAFWVDGPTTLLGSGDLVAAYRVGDGVRIDGELVADDLWEWLASIEGSGRTWVGYLGYGVKAITRGGRPHPSVAPALQDLPDALWIRADRLIELPALPPEPTGGSASGPVIDPTPSTEEERYLAAIAEIKGHLARGESYEVCLTRTLDLDPVEDPLALFVAMRAASPTGRSVYLRSGDLAIASATPEEFVSVDAEGTVSSSPIKGTSARHPDPALDRGSAAGLAADPKTQAENLMIVDLVRNDLHQVCDPASVRVPRFLQVESYATVHQLVSTVTGTLAPGLTRVDAIRAAFPPGSMTGAPKERTMAIIDALEPTPRGIYSGAVGVLGADGSADLRVVIRTAVCTPEGVTLGTGGAITWASDPQSEWEETRLKARAVLAAHADVRKNGTHG